MPKPSTTSEGSDGAARVGKSKKARARTRSRRNRAARDQSKPRIARRHALEHMLPAGPTPPTAGVVYVGHLPHGFYEEEIRNFFGQFGEVTRVRVARSKKTGGVKGYAFVEFSNSEVARIVAETMNRYYLGGKYLVANFIKGEEAHPLLFIGAHRKFKVISWRTVERSKRNSAKSAESVVALAHGKIASEQRRNRALQAAGIDYEFTGTKGALEAAAAAAKPAKRGRDAMSDAEAPAVEDGSRGTRMPGLAELAAAADLPDEDDESDFDSEDVADDDAAADDDDDEDEDADEAMAEAAQLKVSMTAALAEARASTRHTRSSAAAASTGSSSGSKARKGKAAKSPSAAEATPASSSGSKARKGKAAKSPSAAEATPASVGRRSKRVKGHQ